MAVPVVAERANGQLPAEYNEVLELLEAVSLHEAFSEQQKHKCKEWIAAIVKPQRESIVCTCFDIALSKECLV